jgi:hypothetical protein
VRVLSFLQSSAMTRPSWLQPYISQSRPRYFQTVQVTSSRINTHLEPLFLYIFCKLPFNPTINTISVLLDRYRSHIMEKPQTCCKKSGEECTCAMQAKCSCGQKVALHCNCARAEEENKLNGPRCSCCMILLIFPGQFGTNGETQYGGRQSSVIASARQKRTWWREHRVNVG